jgi:hypothetical protein
MLTQNLWNRTRSNAAHRALIQQAFCASHLLPLRTLSQGASLFYETPESLPFRHGAATPEKAMGNEAVSLRSRHNIPPAHSFEGGGISLRLALKIPSSLNPGT